MEKLKLIIAREYKSIVARKSFIVITLLLPVLMVALMALPAFLAWINDAGSEAKVVAVVDHSGGYGKALHSDEDFTFKLIDSTAPDAAPRQVYEQAGGGIEALVVIPTQVDSTGQVSVFSEGTINVKLPQLIGRALSDTITHARIAAHGVPNLQRIIDEANMKVDVKSVKLSDDGTEKEDEPYIALLIGFILAFITYMFVLMYGSMIMNGVIEEKTNRIVEVIVSSCKPFELMMGKILGVLLVGLTQVAVWVVIMGIVGGVASLFLPDLASTADPGMMQAGMNLPSGTQVDDSISSLSVILNVNYGYILLNFVFYFIGGYLLYASLFAAFGSAVDQASDASQFITPIMIIMMVALYAGIACAENPSGPMAVWFSIIPFTSPVVMMVRLPFDVPLWQLALSILLLYGTALLTVWIAARIYRTGILLYGKKHSFKDILTWIK